MHREKVNHMFRHKHRDEANKTADRVSLSAVLHSESKLFRNDERKRTPFSISNLFNAAFKGKGALDMIQRFIS